MAKGIREIELKVLSALMKNSRVSDRELAKRLGVSQPTVSRIRNKFEKEGYIKEYTYIPDFVKFGYNLMALTFIKRTEMGRFREEDGSLFKEANKHAAKSGFDTVMAVRGMGCGYDAVVFSFHEDYSAFLERLREIKQFPSIDVEHVESFIVDLTDKGLYRQLTFSALADHMLMLRRASR
jgi:DNA-binding Lrp family transcriptional regulator